MNKVYFGIAVLSVCIASLSQVLLKLGASKTYTAKFREYLNIYVAGGYAMMLLSMVLTMVAYRELSYLSVPVVEALGYILVPLLSVLVFKEKIQKKKLLGILFILAGMLLYYI